MLLYLIGSLITISRFIAFAFKNTRWRQWKEGKNAISRDVFFKSLTSFNLSSVLLECCKCEMLYIFVCKMLQKSQGHSELVCPRYVLPHQKSNKALYQHSWDCLQHLAFGILAVAESQLCWHREILHGYSCDIAHI